MNDKKIEFAEQIAQLVIDKSYWGNEWFIFFSLLMIALVAATVAAGSSYITTVYKLKAKHTEFQNTLDDLKITANDIKGIEEKISHDFLETRELSRVKREKIEEIYSELDIEYLCNSENLLNALGNEESNYQYPTNKVDMLISLYFKEELDGELDSYREKLKNIKTVCVDVNKRKLVEKVSADGGLKSFMSLDKYFRELVVSKENIQIALEAEMKKLT